MKPPIYFVKGRAAAMSMRMMKADMAYAAFLFFIWMGEVIPPPRTSGEEAAEEAERGLHHLGGVFGGVRSDRFSGFAMLQIVVASAADSSDGRDGGDGMFNNGVDDRTEEAGLDFFRLNDDVPIFIGDGTSGRGSDGGSNGSGGDLVHFGHDIFSRLKGE